MRAPVLIAMLGVLFGAGLAHPNSVSADPPAVRSVEVRGESDRAEVAIRGAFAVPSYQIRTRDNGARIVVQVDGASLPADGVDVEGVTGLVTSTSASTSSHGVELTLQLSRPARYRARSRSGQILVRLDALDDDEAEEPNEGGEAAEVRSVTLERRDGRDRVVIELDGDADYELDAGRRGPAEMRIDGVELSRRVQRQLEGLDDSPIRRVRVRQDGEGAVIEVDRRAHATATALRAGNRIVWLFAEGENEGPRSVTIGREEQSPEVAAFLTDIPMQTRRGRSSRRYSGRRVDLDFRDADIQNILRLLGDVGRVNIVSSDDVSGSVTIRLRNVPWDQALEVILEAKGLGMVRRGNLIRVAPADRLRQEREDAIAEAQAARTLVPLETRLVPVSYARANELSARVQTMLSDRGLVNVDERTNVLIVSDTAANLDLIEELVRALDTQTPQVLIEGRIVEATSQYQRDVGIQWGGDVTFATTNGNPTGIAFPYNVGAAGGAVDTQTPTAGLSPFGGAASSPNFAVNLPAAVGTGSGGALGLTLGSVGGNINLNVRLSALESNGTFRIISSPRILTLDNREAHIAQGTLIPYSQVSAQGVNTAFQEAKLELTVTPHVTADGSVLMSVSITRDEPDFSRTSTRGDPTILKREAETELLIEDGHTAVIGGIYTRNQSRNVDQVPFFGSIPVLGVLFQRRRVADSRNELLIFITPRIVNRAEALGENAG